MPPKIYEASNSIARLLCCRPAAHRNYATAAVPVSQRPQNPVPPPALRYPPTQPPSHKPPEFRKSQLLRQYASLLRSSPLALLFQHNNLKANEWLALRRELTLALRKVDKALAGTQGSSTDLAEVIKIQIVQTGIFGAALRVVEYFKSGAPAGRTPDVPEHSASSSAIAPLPAEERFTHSLSTAAHEAAVRKMTSHKLSPLLSGPLCILSFPTVSPQHLKEAISILSPSPPDFPPPKRKSSPGWHDLTVQSGLQKLILLGARVDGRVLDVDGTKTVGGLTGGLDGMQGQLVALLQGLGVNITSTLESTAKNLYYTLEARRLMVEDEKKAEPVVNDAVKAN